MLTRSTGPKDGLTDFERKMIDLAAKKSHPEERPVPPAPAREAAALVPAPRYNGPTDLLFDTLTVKEYTEFKELFMEKKYGSFGLPPYRVGAENKAFFTKFFVTLAQVRPFISDGLLEKIYIAATGK